MDTAVRKQDQHETDAGQDAPVSSEAATKMSAFMASEEFAPFVLACLARATRDAATEQAELIPTKRRDE